MPLACTYDCISYVIKFGIDVCALSKQTAATCKNKTNLSVTFSNSLIIENSTYNSRRSTSSCLSEQDKLRATWIAGSLAPITRLHFERYKERMIMIVALCYLQRME